MPAPKGNRNAAKSAAEKVADSITFRCPKDLKKRIKKAAKKRKMKPSPWLVEAAEEKCEKEEVK